MDTEIQELKGHYTAERIEGPWRKRQKDDLASRSQTPTRASLRAIEDFAREN